MEETANTYTNNMQAKPEELSTQNVLGSSASLEIIGGMSVV